MTYRRPFSRFYLRYTLLIPCIHLYFASIEWWHGLNPGPFITQGLHQ